MKRSTHSICHFGPLTGVSASELPTARVINTHLGSPPPCLDAGLCSLLERLTASHVPTPQYLLEITTENAISSRGPRVSQAFRGMGSTRTGQL